MRNNFLLKLLLLLCIGFSASNIYSQTTGWEQIRRQYATNALYITNDGTLLISDFLFNGNGGIYISEDSGKTWEKTDAPDYTYNIFVENEDYIFAAGGESRIARSADGGKTWETMSYARALEGTAAENEKDYTQCYAMTIHDGDLYIADFTGGGVMYSEDNGETWNQTDIESLKYGEFDAKLGDRPTENLYNLVSYNGDLYTFGVYFVFKMDNETKSWEALRSDSNFMAISAIYHDKMCCGRSIMNETTEVPFIVTLDENGEWGEIPRPEGFIDNNIRAMHADEDALYVGCGTRGILYTPDEGATWFDISEGLPWYGSEDNKTYDVPMNIKTDKKYIYLAIYREHLDDFGHVSGVYRLSKRDLPQSSVEKIEIKKSAVTKVGTTLRIAPEASTFALYDLNGSQMNIDMTGLSADIASLPQGVYIYKVEINGETQTGKIIR